MDNQRIHSRSDFILKKGLWRWKNGWYDDSHVKNLLNERTDNLAARSSWFSSKRGILRPFYQQELIRFDTLLGEIIRNISRVQFDKAVFQINEADEILRDLEKALPIVERYNMEQKMLTELLEMLNDVNLFQDTPTIKSIIILHQRNRVYLEKKQAQKAKLNLFLCCKEIEHLMSVQMDSHKTGRLKKKLDNIIGLLKNIHSVKSIKWDKDKYLSKVGIIEKLIKSNNLVLADRLLEELELLLGDKILFFSTLKFFKGLLRHSRSRKVIQKGKGNRRQVNYWDSKVKYILSKSLKIDLNYLKKIKNQVDKINKEITKEM